MKRLFTLLFALVMVSEGFSQTYYNWDFTTLPSNAFPAGFVTWKLDGQTASTTDWTSAGQTLFNAAGWVVAPAGALASTRVAATTSDFNNPVAANRWLVTPQINVPAATPNVVLQWDAFSLLGNYPDSYEVLVSTTDSATTSFSTIIYSGSESGSVTTHVLPIAAYAGQTIRVAFRDTTTSGFALILNSIKVVNLPSNKASIYDVEIYEHNYLTQPVLVNGYFSNVGFDTINSFTLNYSVNGGAPVTSPVSQFGLPTQQTSYYSHPTPFNPTTAGTYTISVWLSGLNGSGVNSDTGTTTIFFYPKVAGLVKNVLVEEMTGAGCEFCPGGALILRDAYNKNPHIIPVAIHSGDINGFGVTPADAMQITAGENLITAVGQVSPNFGFPSAMVDRLFTFDNQALATGTQTTDATAGLYIGPNTYLWDSLAAFRQIQATPVNVTITSQVVDTIGGTLSATVNATFLQSLSQGTYNLNLYLVEDSVLTPAGNNGNGYDQENNAYSSQGSAGGTPQCAELYALPVKIIDNGQPHNWAHNHVLRTMAGGSWGTTGIIPSAPVAGTTYSNTYSTILPTTWRYSKVYLVGIVQEYNADVNKRTVLNSVRVPLDLFPAGIVETTEFNKLSVYPNPASTMATVLMDTKDHGLATISILNILGETVVEPTSVLLNTGSQSVNIPVSSLSTGLYFVKVSLNGEVKTLPLSIATK